MEISVIFCIFYVHDHEEKAVKNERRFLRWGGSIFNSIFIFVVIFAGGATKTGQLPMRMRNLPPSFFQQPAEGATALSGQIAKPVVNHSRAHSSPASLEQTYRSAPQQPTHARWVSLLTMAQTDCRSRMRIVLYQPYSFKLISCWPMYVEWKVRLVSGLTHLVQCCNQLTISVYLG